MQLEEGHGAEVMGDHLFSPTTVLFFQDKYSSAILSSAGQEGEHSLSWQTAAFDGGWWLG